MEALKRSRIRKRSPGRCATLQQQWRQAADVPRAQAEALWRRFKAAHDAVWARCEAHFAAQARARGREPGQEDALCEQAEALAESTSWIQTAEEIKRLQAEWKTIGPVSRGQRKGDLGSLPRGVRSILHPPSRRSRPSARRCGPRTSPRRKRSASRPRRSPSRPTGNTAAAEIRRLQAEWKTIGPVKKSRSEAIWQRFRARLRRVLRALRAAPRDRARRARRRARGDCAELEPRCAPAERDVAEPPGRPARRTVRRFAGAGSRRSPPAASIPSARARSTAVRRRVRGVIAAGRRPSPAPISIPTPIASGWRRWCGASKNSPRRWPARRRGRRRGAVADDAARRDVEGSAGREHDWRQGRRRQPVPGGGGRLRQAQANWSRIGPVPEEARRALADRFQRAIAARIAASSSGLRAGRPGGPASDGRPGGSGTGRPGGLANAYRPGLQPAACPYWILSSSTSKTSMPVRCALLAL